MQRESEVRPVPLASQALCSPYTYEPSYEVHIQLDEPLWMAHSGLEVISMDIMGLCVQLETILLSHKDSTTVGASAAKRVSFEKGIGSQTSAVLQLMTDALRKAGHDTEVESFLRESGIGYLFPRVELFLQEPDQDLSIVESPILSGYLSQLTALNNVLALSQQIHTDLLTSSSHKYIAHQIALIYQCVSHISQLTQFKKEIEEHFTEVKAMCTPQSTGHPPRLPSHLHSWLVSLAQRLIALTSSPLSHLTAHHPHITEVLAVVSPS